MFDYMFNYLGKLAKRYSRWWLVRTNMGKSENLTVFDFKKPWWAPFFEKKVLLVVILSGRVISMVIGTLIPIFLGYAITSGKPSSFLFLLIILTCSELWRYITVIFSSKFIASIISGLRYSAYKFFLTVDPIAYTKGSTGEIFGKMERCAFAYEEFIDSAIYDILPVFVGISTVVISFFMVNIKIGLLALCFLAFLCLFNAGIVLFNGLAFEKKVIKSDDDVKKRSLESLIQIQLVRSSFATNEVNQEVKHKNTIFMATDANYFISYHTLMFVIRFLYSISFCILGAYVLYLISQGVLTAVVGTAFLITYIHGTRHIIKIGKRVQKLVRSVTRIKDLFDFIHDFGKKTFPVLKEDFTKAYEMPNEDVISVQATNLNFAYREARIFQDHNLDFVVPQAQENKLYGIIGPSGAGKTTFISILGGQIKPNKGEIEINDVPIYGINDNLRRQIIALQGQSASSLSGTLKENLLLGIPQKISLFNDEYMENILKRVGIWEIFKEKEGIYSMIGEGGLNLSLGQRQRLNFASLYLRTQYYRPLLVMIDEPTSSLDEVSEHAITDMIDEIAKRALVFVIAHRLVTLDNAVGILDFSLLDEDKELMFYKRDKLIEKSEFYRKLIRGEVAIEE
ncbi:ATP-binding cassette domain-containing protein [Candidatus Dependentiae bacterium]